MKNFFEESIIFLVDAAIFPSKKSLPINTPTQSSPCPSVLPRSTVGTRKLRAG